MGNFASETFSFLTLKNILFTYLFIVAEACESSSVYVCVCVGGADNLVE